VIPVEVTIFASQGTIFANGQTGGTMPTPTTDLRALVGKKVRIERDGVTHKGVLMGKVYRHVKGSKVARKRWVLFSEDGWTVTPVPPPRQGH
jgi:hypothetical protein